DLGLRLGSGSELLNLDETLFLLFTFAAFVMVDALAAAIAFWHEGDEDWRLLLWLVPQRFYYRQLIYIVAIRATLAAVRGSFVGWGVLSRTANVSIAGWPEQGSSRLAR